MNKDIHRAPESNYKALDSNEYESSHCDEDSIDYNLDD